MIGFLDTGIDYTNRLFCKPQQLHPNTGESGIGPPCQWTRMNSPRLPDPTMHEPEIYGTGIHLKNRSQQKPWPQTIRCPWFPQDTNGHGTFIAGDRRRGSLPDDSFTGEAGVQPGGAS